MLSVNSGAILNIFRSLETNDFYTQFVYRYLKLVQCMTITNHEQKYLGKISALYLFLHVQIVLGEQQQQKAAFIPKPVFDSSG